MIITIINGSPRSDGSTGKILLRMKEILKNKKNLSINYIDLNKYKMKFCTGCCQCYKRGNGCIIKDDGIEDLSILIGKSDGLIVGSPTYASNVHSLLKNLIDRGHFVVEQLLDNKYCFTVATYSNKGVSGVIKILNDLFVLSGGILLGKYIHKLHHNVDPFQNKVKEKELIKKTEKIYKSIKNKKRRSLLNYIIIRLVRIIGLKPLVKHKDYNGVKLIWQKKGLI